jgi:arylsulfatase A-like enzyme
MTGPRNVLIFMTDQQRGDTALPEHPARTPVLDAFARDGLLFADARSPSPHCCPSRASFFTGLWPSEHGVWNNVAVQNALSRELAPGVRLWSSDLAAAGWRCRFDGKWHVSATTAPRDHGWEEGRVTAKPFKDGDGVMGMTWESFADLARRGESDERPAAGVLRPGWGTYVHYGTNENPFGDQHIVDSALHGLRELCAQDRPWCHFIGTLGPHDPYTPPRRFLDLYPDLPELPPSHGDAMADKPAFYRKTRAPFDQLSERERREAIRHYWAFCSYEDWLFGQVLAALEASGQAEDTLVVYTSDHGDYVAEHGLWCKGLPCFRPAYHIPLAMRWPRGIRSPGRRIEAPVQAVDVANTVRDLAGLPPGPGSGRSLRPFLEGRSPSAWRRLHATQSNGNEQYGIQRSVDDGRWKYVYNGFDEDELYDLAADPHQVRNLAREPRHADEVRRQCARMWAFAREHGDQCVNAYVMVAHAPVGPAAAFRGDGSPIPSEG